MGAQGEQTHTKADVKQHKYRLYGLWLELFIQ